MKRDVRCRRIGNDEIGKGQTKIVCPVRSSGVGVLRLEKMGEAGMQVVEKKLQAKGKRMFGRNSETRRNEKREREREEGEIRNQQQRM